MEKYITRDDYLAKKGIDLNVEIQDDDNASRKVTRFIEDITDWIIDLLVHKYGANELRHWNELSEWRQKRFRDGVIEQIEYVLRNGLISLDSGINKDTGMINDYSRLFIAPNAYRKFFLGAFCNI